MIPKQAASQTYGLHPFATLAYVVRDRFPVEVQDEALLILKQMREDIASTTEARDLTPEMWNLPYVRSALEQLVKLHPENILSITELETAAKELIGKSRIKHHKQHNNTNNTNSTNNKQPFSKRNSEEILSLLNEQERIECYLDQGITEEGDFYYGFKLGSYDAIITSQGNVFLNRKTKHKGKEFGEDEINEVISYSGFIGDIAPRIPRSAVKLIHQKNGHEKITNFELVFKKLKECIDYFMDLSNKPEISTVLTCWVISTYFFTLFRWFPHLLLNAPSQSGKTKLGVLLTTLSFRGYDIGTAAGGTPAQIFRTLESNRGTILIDEYEQIGSESQSLLNQLINASARKDAYIIRPTPKGNDWIPRRFQIFSPKIVANISGLNPTTLSRCITIPLWKTTNKEKANRDPIDNKEGAKLMALRESLYIMALEHWEQIRNSYDTFQLPSFLVARDADNFRPLYAIADNIQDQKIKEELEGFALSCINCSQGSTSDPTESLFAVLLHHVVEERYYSLADILDIPGISEVVDGFKGPRKWIGRRLTNYRFEKRRGSAGAEYYLCPKAIRDVINRYFPNLRDQSPPISTVVSDVCVVSDVNTNGPNNQVIEEKVTI